MNIQHNGYAPWARTLVAGLVVLESATAASAQTPMPRLEQQGQAPLLISPMPPGQPGWANPMWTPAAESGHGVSFWDTIKQSVFGQRSGEGLVKELHRLRLGGER